MHLALTHPTVLDNDHTSSYDQIVFS